MARPRRLQIIRQLEKERKSTVISYVTSTRQNMNVQMALDAVRQIYDHLEAVGGRPPIDLFLHSNGGDTTVPWRLVTLIREYTDNFRVIVPHRAFSAATLTALGANEILMHPMGMLGPTDATVGTPFNPANPSNPGERLGINVEDVTAYIALIKEDAGIQHEDELVQAFNLLGTQVHPLALGAVKRTLSQSRMMARKLLCLHMDVATDAHKIDEIIDNLTSKLFFHGHPINRVEAKEEIGLQTIGNPSAKIESLIWRLYKEYEKDMLLDVPLKTAQEFVRKKPNMNIGDQDTTNPETLATTIIESGLRADIFEWEYVLSGQKLQNGSTQVISITKREEWVTET